MKKIFFLKDVPLHDVCVSTAGFVGLPAITGLLGFSGALALEIARELELEQDTIVASAALMAIENYFLHEGYKRTFKQDVSPVKGTGKFTPVAEAVPAAFADFTAHFAIELEARTVLAQERLTNLSLDIVVEIVMNMSFCKGKFGDIPPAVNLAHPALIEKIPGTERERVLKLLPSASLVLCDASPLVADMRAEGLPLMEGLIAATLPQAKRPALWKNFFETAADGCHADTWRLAPSMNGTLLIEEHSSTHATRTDAFGRSLMAYAGTPTFTLVQLQKASVLRFQATKYQFVPPVFWTQVESSSPPGYFCVAQ
jgi:hypothetical protein